MTVHEGQVWRGVVRSPLRSIARVDDNGNLVFIGDNPFVPKVIDVLVLRDPAQNSNLALVEAIDVDQPSGRLQYWEDVEKITAGRLDP